MPKQRLAVVALLFGVGAFLLSRNANASTGERQYDVDISFDDWHWHDDAENFDMLSQQQREENNLAAFLYMIRRAEHNAHDAQTGNAYNVVYGGATFRNMADHPAITGEWSGKTLSDAMCARAGYGPGCVSTAAGAYQIIKPTWMRVRRPGAWGAALTDFSAPAQDEAARRLLIEQNALDMVRAGDLAGAVYRVAPVWASLPGYSYGQNPKAFDTIAEYFAEGGGVAVA